MEELIPSLCSNDLDSKNKEQLNKRPFIEIFLSGNNVRGLVDTGAAISAIDEKLFYQLKGPETFKNEKIPYHHKITAANGGRIMVVSQYKVTFDILGRALSLKLRKIETPNNFFSSSHDNMRALLQADRSNKTSWCKQLLQKKIN